MFGVQQTNSGTLRPPGRHWADPERVPWTPPGTEILPGPCGATLANTHFRNLGTKGEVGALAGCPRHPTVVSALTHPDAEPRPLEDKPLWAGLT